ncbi:hypothetical protein [Flavobacterium gilvum]|uniref:Uncharacterized protein n=1 Tax=Flavobacterium gilvum TaxID=1492737 RepID=A0AAC9I3A3_9FLAO|nr:hypothetical protein [Flavobacterium gilvum]AOW09499.1 hypothetical protein EM308_08305 [Flavobacterium gilvum]KFC60005.1 hypothetical protein FEM08_11840 [Flavobacterium gilvum]
MAKQFTKVTKTYSTKNKLQLLIHDYLKTVDFTLFANKQEASNYIKELYEKALREYKGNAAVPPLKTFEGNKNDTHYYVDDVISISVYNVQNDFS